ncbi:MAG: hypothetical protein IKF17_01100 [Clostridia bacterium]|nr:hypothetical protein [Clostridia bacterium]
MEEIKVGEVIISKQIENTENFQKFKQIITDKKIKVKVVNKGDRISIEKNLYFDIIWPNNNDFILENALNNNSIVCKISYNNFSMLFTGDIEEQAEVKILQEYEDNIKILKSEILKVAHHGSKTSTTIEFLKAVNPKVALIGVGKNNKFGHPSNEVIQRLEEKNTKKYRTDEMGEITIKVNKKGAYNIKK